ASESTEVLDHEFPSGGFVSRLSLFNNTLSWRGVTIFHYLDADAGGSGGGDSCILLDGTKRSRFMKCIDDDLCSSTTTASPSWATAACRSGPATSPRPTSGTCG